MSVSVTIAGGGPVLGMSAAELLEQCRLLAGARLVGDVAPADRAHEALCARYGVAQACHVFGALHLLVARLSAEGAVAFRWRPPGARWPSEDERRLLEETLAPLARGPGGETAAIVRLAETFCPEAKRGCPIHAALGQPCETSCFIGASEGRG
mgnify:CR=1 FL=1